MPAFLREVLIRDKHKSNRKEGVFGKKEVMLSRQKMCRQTMEEYISRLSVALETEEMNR
jgi:hypothetical protein